jgi:N-acetylglucosamine kinase-like BadF-type ATPase
VKRNAIANPRWLLLADAGATHSRALVVAANGAILGRGAAGPANAYAVGNQAAVRNLDRAVRAAVRSSRVSASEIPIAVIGSASVDFDGTGSPPIKRALRRWLPHCRTHTVVDAWIALEGALLGKPGVVVVSGTGSIVLGKTPRGGVLKIGGWGPLLGDEGSAQWIARRALQAAAQAHDGTGPPTSLLRVFMRHFHLNSFERVIDIVYDHPLSPGELGAQAPLVTAAARRGDVVARAIFSQAGQALAIQTVRALRRLRLSQPLVSYQGSMFRAGRFLLAPFHRALKRAVPRAAVVAPALPPLGGAFLLALAEVGVPATPAALARFRRNCHG